MYPLHAAGLFLLCVTYVTSQSAEDKWKFSCDRMDIFSFVAPLSNAEFPYDVECKLLDKWNIRGK